MLGRFGAGPREDKAKDPHRLSGRLELVSMATPSQLREGLPVNQSLRAPIIEATKEVEEYERSVIGYLKSSLLHSDSSIELEEIYLYEAMPASLEEAGSIVENSGGKVVSLTDAAVGNTEEYEPTFGDLDWGGIRPFVLVTHANRLNKACKMCV